MTEEKIIEALKNAYREAIEEVLKRTDNDTTFEKAGVIMPKDDIWRRYAKHVMEIV